MHSIHGKGDSSWNLWLTNQVPNSPCRTSTAIAVKPTSPFWGSVRWFSRGQAGSIPEVCFAWRCTREKKHFAFVCLEHVLCSDSLRILKMSGRAHSCPLDGPGSKRCRCLNRPPQTLECHGGFVWHNQEENTVDEGEMFWRFMETAPGPSGKGTWCGRWY